MWWKNDRSHRYVQHGRVGADYACPRYRDKVRRLVCAAAHKHGRERVEQVTGALADDMYMDADTGKFSLEKAGLMSYSHGGICRSPCPNALRRGRWRGPWMPL